MTTTTISAAADLQLAPPATRGKTDVWAEFYAQVNSYDEPVRPSLADVVAVRDSLAAVLDSGVGQHSWESVQLPSGQSWAGQSTVGGAYARTFRMELSPGTIAVGSKDFDQSAITEEDAFQATRKAIDMSIIGGDYDDGGESASAAEITAWSAKSRAHMTRVLGSLDYSDREPVECGGCDAVEHKTGRKHVLPGGWPVKDGALAMVTLTLPGDWKPVAPNGKAFKRSIEVFRRRFVRAVGPWRLLWKLEFQRRGAPHFHALMRVPALVTWNGGYHHKLNYEIVSTFEDWLAWTWADIVGASEEIDTIGRWVPFKTGRQIPLIGFDGLPVRDYAGAVVMREEITYGIDEHFRDGEGSSERSRHLAAGTGIDFSGKDFSDPRRIPMYFAGHSAKSQDGKEYQHIVPAKWRSPGNGPGRFWGFSGLDKAVAVLELTQRDYDRVRRELRKLSRARAWEIAVKRKKGAAVRENQPVPSAFRVRRPMARKSQLGGNGGQNGGWVLLNDALAVARGLSRWLSSTAECLPGCTYCGHVEPSECFDGVLKSWSAPVLV